MQPLYPAATFYLSHRPVREAIQALASEGWYKEWNGYNETLHRAAIPRNVVFDYEPCLDDPAEDERRRQIKRGRTLALERQRCRQDELYSKRRSVDRILDELGFGVVSISGGTPQPRFVALCEDEDAPLLTSYKQKRSCCAPRSDGPRFKRAKMTTDLSASSSSAAMDVLSPTARLSPGPPETLSSAALASGPPIQFDETIDDNALLLADAVDAITCAPNDSLYDLLDGSDDDDAVLLFAETVDDYSGPADATVVYGEDMVDDNLLLQADWPPTQEDCSRL